MRRLYGYTLIMTGQTQSLGIPDSEEATNVEFIYQSYLEGYSLGGIVKLLAQREIPSPTGKPTWGRAAIDQMLSNPKYTVGIISEEVYERVQEEKRGRSNVEVKNGIETRKATHYSSKGMRNQVVSSVKL